jgi:hypothetical protein
VLWQAQQGPWENGAFSGPNSGLFKSTDGGDNWSQLTGGLPTFQQGLGRIGIGIAPSDRNRMYALVDAGGRVADGYQGSRGGMAVSTAPTMPALPGSASTARIASTAADRISPACASTPRTRT